MANPNQGLAHLFRMADQDGDGSIDKEEMKDLFRAAGAVDVTDRAEPPGV